MAAKEQEPAPEEWVDRSDNMQDPESDAEREWRERDDERQQEEGSYTDEDWTGLSDDERSDDESYW